MPVEIEKKYRLTKPQLTTLRQRLPAIGAVREGSEFEENTLYSGPALDLGRRVLRLRRAGKKTFLTYKERLPSTSSIKQQQEDETAVSDADAMDAILRALGFVPALVYEKLRETWELGNAEIVLDELPFGHFMEIEGPEPEIRAAEKNCLLRH